MFIAGWNFMKSKFQLARWSDVFACSLPTGHNSTAVFKLCTQVGTGLEKKLIGFKVMGSKVEVIQWWPSKCCPLDSSWITEGSWTRTYTNIVLQRLTTRVTSLGQRSRLTLSKFWLTLNLWWILFSGLDCLKGTIGTWPSCLWAPVCRGRIVPCCWNVYLELFHKFMRLTDWSYGDLTVSLNHTY